MKQGFLILYFGIYFSMFCRENKNEWVYLALNTQNKKKHQIFDQTCISNLNKNKYGNNKSELQFKKQNNNKTKIILQANV